MRKVYAFVAFQLVLSAIMLTVGWYVMYLVVQALWKYIAGLGELLVFLIHHAQTGKTIPLRRGRMPRFSSMY